MKERRRGGSMGMWGRRWCGHRPLGLFAAMALMVVATACSGPDPAISLPGGTETHWLKCETDAACAEADGTTVHACICGVCTSPCESDDACEGWLDNPVCMPAGQARPACGEPSEGQVCVPQCALDGTCPAGRPGTVVGVCVPRCENAACGADDGCGGTCACPTTCESGEGTLVSSDTVSYVQDETIFSDPLLRRVLDHLVFISEDGVRAHVEYDAEGYPTAVSYAHGADDEQDVSLVWEPDRASFVVVHDGHGTRERYTLEPDGSWFHGEAISGTADSYTRIEWSPDGLYERSETVENGQTIGLNTYELDGEARLVRETREWVPFDETTPDLVVVTTYEADSVTRTETQYDDVDGSITSSIEEVNGLEANGLDETPLSWEADHDGDGNLDATWVWTYDEDGNPLTYESDTDGDGVADITETWTRVDGKLSTVIRMEGGVVTGSTTCTYDASTLKLRCALDVGNDEVIDQITYDTYNADGEVFYHEIDVNADGTIDMALGVLPPIEKFDDNGHLISRLRDINDDGVRERLELWVYDDAGRMLSYEEDKNGDGKNEYAERRAWDSEGRPLLYEQDTDDDDVIDLRETWTYTADGQPLTYLLDSDHPWHIGTSETWEYDELGHVLTYSLDSGNDGVLERYEVWAYDAAGNPLVHRIDGDGNGVVDGMGRWFYDTSGNLVEHVLDVDFYDNLVDRLETFDYTCG